MKSILVNLLLYLFLTTTLVAQTSKIDSLLTAPEIETDFYEPEIKSGKLLLLKMVYGSTEIKNVAELSQLTGATILTIDLLYSDHPKAGDFSLLIKKRLSTLRALNPSLFQDHKITWRLVRQTNCSSITTAKKLFHGFAITYRPIQKEESIEEELDYLEKMLFMDETTLGDSFYESEAALEEDNFTSRYDTMVGSNGELLIRRGTGKRDSVKYSKDFDPKKDYSLKKKNKDSPSKTDKDKGSSSRSYSSFYVPKPDSTIFKVLDRNEWKNMLIVSDVTGSMSPYTGQLLRWFRLNTIDKKVKHFVFFNDGDRKHHFEKELGKTGGIYNIPSSEYKEVEALVYESMRNGNGGDGPENDIEALIEASILCPDCESIVLIADNWSTIKDIELLKKIKKPIKIILCGADIELNTEYLDLAKATGGSVHTMEDDLVNLMDLKKGQIIKIGKREYRIERGKFVRLRKI